ncbi:SDR family NAD(P)-dependent oxidoreductase [Streptomyces sp. PSKA54]|uniref:SDR family NAD(P)-dependent oxidoreductase n=1 Tax=Streptomyces himalayensis subsp. aureolus TaxID=2758039 RepID=A0A7W2CXB9_9ACTN|nr:SDR family NAD(P)-dependent oxidoreductase [Streptomyces himalayensis]MBA4860854.1 SDR family NAD(P)-dependent oxidoreductase [Streptomyces himalayensis subsp. aureolus]
MSKPLVVVTGAGHGIGRAVAAAFAAEQHPLLLVSRHPTPLGGLPADQVLPAAVDVADYAALEAAVQGAEARYGPTECIVNCAGFLRIGALETRAPADVSYEVDVLLKGVLNGIRVVLGTMKARRSGTIINVSSIGDRVPGPDGEVYHACKAALRSLAGSLQKSQAANNIRVINVAPGFVRTDIHAEMGISFEEYCERLGHPDFISADQLADIILFCWKQPQRLCVRDIVVLPTSSDFG